MNEYGMKKISLGRMITMLMMLCIVVVGGTFAWFTYSSKQSALVLTIGEINDTQIKLSPYQIKETITPGNTYTSGVYSEVEVVNGGERTTSVVLYYKINQLDTNLIDKGLAYTIVDSSTGQNVKSGYFSDLIDTSKPLPEEVVILDESTSLGETSNYKVYLWLDSSKAEQSELQNSSLDMELNGSIGSVSISGVNTYGQKLTANVVDTNTNATYTYQWYSNTTNSTTGGTAISGATGKEYTIGTGLVGKYIYVVANAVEDYYEDRIYTDVTDVENNTTPTVDRKAATLTVNPKTLNLTYPIADSSTISYTYDGDGTVTCNSADTNIATCTVNASTKKVTVTPKSAAFSTTISLSATQGANYKATTSANVTVSVAKGTMTAGTVTISGTNAYGNSLTATVSTDTNPKADRYKYQWYSNTTNSTTGGTAISGATSSTYVINSSDVGKYIYVIVTGEKQYYNNISFSDITDSTNNSSAVVAPKGVSGLTVTLGTTEYTYDGNAKTPSVTVKDGSTTLTKGTHYNVSYSSNINVGTATVTITGINAYAGTLTKTFTIVKLVPEISINPTSGTVNYNSTATFTATTKTSVNVAGTLTATSGATSFVTITGGASNSITATSSGVAKTITYKGVAATTTARTITVTFTPTDTNNIETVSKTFSVTSVNKVDATCPTLTAYSGTYDGSAHGITVSGGSGGTVQYSTDNSTWSATNKTYTDYTNGAKTIYVRVNGDSNHNTKTCGSSTVTINQATPTITLSSESGTVTYNSTATFTATTKATPNAAGTLTATSGATSFVTITGGASNSITATSSGVAKTITYKGVAATTTARTITVTFTPSSTNFKTVSKTFSVTSVNKVDATCPTLTAYSGTYDGSAHGITVSGGSGGTVQYSTDNSTWSATNKTYTDYTNGAKTVYVRVNGDSNHNTKTCGSSTVTINQATPTITLSSESGTVAYNSTATFTATTKATPNAAGTLTATSGATSFVTITGGASNSITATSSGVAKTITYKGVAATTTARTITVTFTPSSTNFKTVSKTFSVTKVDKDSCTCTISSAPTLEYPKSTTGNIEYTCTGDGIRSVVSGTTGVITVGTVGTTSTPLTAKSVGTSKITVSQAAGTNYKACASDSEDITVGASTYTINYYLGNGTDTAGTTKLDSSTCKYGSSCTLTSWSTLGGTFPLASSNKWSFAGWSTSQTGTTVNYTNSKNFTYNLTSDLNLYAVGSRTYKFYAGKAPTSMLGSDTQYWNPYSTSTSYATTIDVPTATAISGWSFVGYRANNTASSQATIKNSTYKGAPDSLTAMDFRAIYKRTVTVSYNANGGSGTTDSTTGTQYYNSGIATSSGTNNGANVSDVSITLASNAFTRAGYSFSKWAEGSASGTEYAAGASYTFDNAVDAASSVTMYAKWNANSYKISTTANGGTITPSTTTPSFDAEFNIKATKTVKVTGNANNTGATVGSATSKAQTFAGWTSSSGLNTSTAKYGTASGSATTAWSDASTKVGGATTYFKNLTATKDATVTLVANWTAVAFNLPTVTKTGYTCTWNTKSDGSGTSYASGASYTPTATSAASITMYATCTKNSYKITTTANGGTITPSTTTPTFDTEFNIKATKTVTVTGNANNTGATVGSATSKAQTFAGWTSSSGLNTSTAKYGTTSGSATTAWSSASTKVGGETTYFKNLTATKDATVTLVANWTAVAFNLPTVTKTGYTCTWNTKSDGSGTSYASGASYTPTATSAASITMYATCTKNSYKITTTANGGTITPSTTTPTFDTEFNIKATKTVTVTGNANNTGATVGSATSKAQTFAGWTSSSGLNTSTAKYGTTSGSATTAWSSASTKVGGATTYFKNLTATKDATVTLVANWTAVAFNLPTVTKTGYTCTWNTKSDGSGTSYASGASYTPTATSAASITVYASCTKNSYKITTTANGGTITPSTTTPTFDAEFNIKATKTVTVTGNVNGTGATVGSATSKAQTFAGWTSSSGLNTSTAKYGTASGSATTSWTNASTKVGAATTYFKNLTATKDATVTLVANWTAVAFNLPTVTKNGYTCTWNTKSDGSGTSYASGASYTPTTTSAASITMYAICSAKSYKLINVSNNNIISNGGFETYSLVNAPSKTANGVTHTWDGTLNGVPGNTSKAYNVTSWGIGSNMGVAVPEIGYHAHMRIIDNNAVFRFKTNEDYNGKTKADLSDGVTVTAGTVSTNRWLGISQNLPASKITAGKTYVLTVDLYRVSGSTYITGGPHYATTSDSTSAFNSGQCEIKPTKTGAWETLSCTFTIDEDYSSSVAPKIYIYGYLGAPGELYLDNVRFEEAKVTTKNYGTNFTSTELAEFSRSGYTFAGWYNNSSLTTKLSTSSTFTTSTATFENVGTAGTNARIYGKWTGNALTFNNQSFSVTYSTSAQSKAFTGATNGTGSYSYTISGTGASNFSISGSNLSIAANTPAGTYTLTVTANDSNSGSSKAATFTVTVGKASCSCTISSASTDMKYPGSTSGAVNYSCGGDGTITVTSGTTSVITVGTVGTSNTPLTAKGVGTSKITVGRGAGTNYNACTSANKDVTVGASTYTITFDRQGGTGGASTATATYGSTVPNVSAPVKTGYTFGGYYSNTSAIDLEYTVEGSTYRRLNLLKDSNGWGMTTASDSGKHIQGIITLTDSALTSAPTSLQFSDYALTSSMYKVTGSSGSWTYYLDFDITADMVSKRGNYDYETQYRFIDFEGSGISSSTTVNVISLVKGGKRYYNASGTGIWNYDVSGVTTLYAKWNPVSYTLTVNPNGGTYNGTTSNSTFTQAYDTVKNVGAPSAAPAGYKVTFNANGGTCSTANLTNTKTFSGWTLSGTGKYVAASNATTNGFTKTSKTESGESYDNFAFSKSGLTASTWYSIRYPVYTYTSGDTYDIRLKVRVNELSGTSFTLRHAAFSNDYGSSGYKSKALSTSMSDWTDVVLTRTMSGTTTTLGSSTKTIAPQFEGYTGDLKGVTAEVDFDIKNMVVINTTKDTLLQSNANAFLYRAGAGTLTASYSNGSITLPTPTRTGFTFKGWYTASSGGTKVGDAGGSYTPTAATTLYAQWSDSAAPSVPTYNAFYADGSGAYTSGTWTTKNVHTTLTTTDAGSGIYMQYQESGTTTWTTFGFGISALTQSGTTWSGTENWGVRTRNQTYYFRACDSGEDGVKNNSDDNCSGNSAAFNIRYDMDAPSVSYNAFYASDNSSYTSGNIATSVVHTKISAVDSHVGTITKIQYTANANATAEGTDYTTQWKTLNLSISGGIKAGESSGYYGTESWSFSSNRNNTFYFRACDSLGNCSAKSSAFNIRYATVVTKPTASSHCNSLTYNKSSQTLTKTPGTGYTFSNNTRTNAGSQTVTATLSSGYVWGEGQTSAATFSCSIAKASCTCSISNTPSLSYPGSPTGNITYTCGGDGTRSVTSGTTSVITVGTVGTTSTPLTAKAAGTSKITVSQAAGTNYNACTSDNENVTVSNSSYTITYYLGNGTSTAGSTQIGTSTCTAGSSCTLTSWSTLGGTFPLASENGWSFAGWSTSQTGTTVAHTDGKTISSVTSNLNLYAVGSRTFKFYSGIAPTSVTATKVQYWNPYSTASTYTTSIDVPTGTAISGWEFLGYRANDTAAADVTVSGTTYDGKANSLTSLELRAKYKRTVTVAYNANGGSGTTSSQTGTQYYSSGYVKSGANSGAKVSKPTFTLATNGFSKTGFTFSKWAAGSASGTEYAAGATYTFSNGVSAASSVTMHAKWVDSVAPTAPTYVANYKDGSGTYTSGTWTNKNVNTTISTTDAGTGIYIQYQESGGSTWSTFNFSEGALTQSGTTWSGTEPWGLRTRNQTYYFRACDSGEDGVKNNSDDNCSGKSAAFNIRYDLDAPSTPTLTTIYNLWNSRDYELRNFSSDAGKTGTWTTSTGDPSFGYSGITDISGINGGYIQLDSALSSDMRIQIFYAATGGSFSESNSNIAVLSAGQKEIYIPFTNSGTWTQFRFDMGDNANVSFKVKYLGVSGTANQWNRDNIIIGSTSSDNAGITNWQYSYNTSEGWNNLGGSGKTTLYDAYSSERNQNTYIRACDALGNCSSGASTKIMIDKTKPSISNVYTASNLFPTKSPNSTNTVTVSGNNMTTTGTDPFVVFSGLSSTSVSKAVISLGTATSKIFTLQIFYATSGTSFSEANSVKVENIPVGTTTIVATLPGGNYTALRFDLGGESGVTFNVTGIDVVGGNISTSNYIHADISDSSSKVSSYTVNTSSSTPSSFTNITDVSSYHVRYSYSTVTTYYIWGKDGAGNIGNSNITVSASKLTNTLSVSGKSLTYSGSAQSLATASNAQGTVYYSTSTQLTSSNYSSSGSTTIPTATNAGSYTVYYYTPGNTNYNATSGSVSTTIAKASCTCEISSYTSTMKYNSATSGTISYTCGGDGTRKVTSSDTTKITVGTVGTTSTPLTAVGIGSSTIKVEQAAGTNYNACTSDTQSISVAATTYTVQYNACSGSGAPSNQTKSYGTALTLSTTKPTLSNYTFQGWSTEGCNTSVTHASGGSYTTNAAATMYAIWKINSVTLSYNANGGSLSSLFTAPIEHEYTVPITGDYKLETWGAQGGGAYALTVSSSVQKQIASFGGYSVGTISLTAGQKLYVNVGGASSMNSTTNGTVAYIPATYNGGGKTSIVFYNYQFSAGGGATHIATASGTLSSLSSHATNCKNSNSSCPILIAAGGGGGFITDGAGNYVGGGNGGGYIGNSVTQSTGSTTYVANGGSQTAGGTGKAGSTSLASGSFGKGGDGASNGGTGGGGGFYGGGVGAAGGGGSGYIGHPSLTSKSMYCYGCTASSSTNTKTVKTTNSSVTPTSNYVKIGFGAAKITMVTTSKTVTNGSTYGTLPTPYRQGYTFKEWNTKSDGTGTKITSSTTVNLSANQTIYAIWTSGEDTHKLLYMNGNQYTSNTGGWVKKSSSGTYTFNASYSGKMLLSTNSSSASATVCTKNKIDITNYATLIFWTDYAKGSGTKKFGISTNGSSYTVSQNFGSGYTYGLLTLDISDYTGSYYICHTVGGSGTSNETRGVFVVSKSGNLTSLS